MLLVVGGSFPNPNNPMSFLGEQVQILSWNGRGICVYDSSDMERMRCEVQRLARNRHILCFQEVHGRDSEIVSTFSRWLPNWKICGSACVADDGLQLHASGGVVTAICPALVRRCSFVEKILVPGRCVDISILCGCKSFDLLNVAITICPEFNCIQLGNISNADLTQFWQILLIALLSFLGI